MVSGSCWPNSESWRRYWPSCIMGLIATIQLIVSFAILAIHIVIVVIGVIVFCFGASAWYIMGFVCWGFFFACWISVFCVTCCNRSSFGCATYVLIKNILAFIFSAVLIDFDRKFITYQYFYDGSFINGYFDYNLCPTYSSNSDVDFGYISLSLAKGQLAGAVVMLVTSLIFVGIYIYVYIRALRHNERISNNMFSAGGSHPQMQSASYVITPEASAYHAGLPIDYGPQPLRYHNNSQIIKCSECGASIVTAERF